MPSTLAGAIRRMPAPKQVRSIGLGANDGWTVVHEFPGSALPDGDGNYRFVIQLTVGAPDWTPWFAIDPTWAMIEVEVTKAGNNGVGIGKTESRFFLTGFDRGSGIGRPLTYIIDPATDDPTLNLASSTLQVQARIFGLIQEQKGPGLLGRVSPLFHVLDCSIMAFDLDVIAGNAQAYHGESIEAKQQGRWGWPGGDAEGFEVRSSSTPTFGASAEQWLVFHELRHTPSSKPAHIDFLEIEGGNTRSAMGYQEGTRSFHGYFGCGPLGHDVEICTYSLGGFHLSTLNGATRMEIRTRDNHDNNPPNTGKFTRLHHWRHFAIRMDTFAVAHAYDRDNLRGSDGLTTLYYPNTLGTTTRAITREFANGNFADFVILGQASRHTFNTNASPYRLDLELASGQKIHAGHNVSARQFEGIPQHAVGVESRFRPGSETVSMRLTLNGLATGGVFAAGDMQLVGFYFETDPEVIDIGQEVAGPRVYINPGKETLVAPASMTTFPIQPTNAIQEGIELPLVELRAVNGTRITFPRQMLPRLTPVSLQWQGLTDTGRDTMSAWVETNAGKAIRWQAPDDDAERVYAMVGPAEPFNRSSAGLYSWGLQLVELIYGDGITPTEVD